MILEGLRNFGGGVEPPLPPRYATGYEAAGWNYRVIGVEFRQGHTFFCCLQLPESPRPIQPLIRWKLEALSPGLKRSDMEDGH